MPCLLSYEKLLSGCCFPCSLHQELVQIFVIFSPHKKAADFVQQLSHVLMEERSVLHGLTSASIAPLTVCYNDCSPISTLGL